jgi:predicted esterase
VIEPAIFSIETAVHGRYLVRPATGTPVGVLFGFHGYAETAERHLQALEGIPGVERWLVVAVQALHPFYTREQRVVANWMTSQDRERAIADNLAYVRGVVNAVAAAAAPPNRRVFAGFSQGGAMAYRAAAHLGADGVIILAADVPPDVAQRPGVRLPRVLLGRGTTDPWYTKDKQDADVATLTRAGADVETCVFEGAHAWTPEFCALAGEYLQRLVD